MILTEDYGNLQALSPQVLKFCFDYYSTTKMGNRIGKNSDVKIAKENEISDYLKKYTPNELPLIILRYKNVEKIYFYAVNDIGYGVSFNPLDRRWDNTGIKKYQIEGLRDIYERYYGDEVPSFEDFLKKISYQLVFTDKDRLQKQQQRKDYRGDILKVSKDKTYQTSDDWHRGNDRKSKIHGSIYDDRNIVNYYSGTGYWEKDLQKRLKAYVESKFPTFNSLEDFINTNIKDILKAFKINGCVYKYDDYATNQINNPNYSLYSLYLKKKAYIGYEKEIRNIDNLPDLPNHIFFEIIMDVNNNVKVSNIYGLESGRHYDSDLLKPLSDFIKKEEDKSKESKLSHNYNTDEDDDW